MSNLKFPFSGLLFDEEEHRYYFEGRALKSVTSLLKQTLFADKYGDVDPVVLANAANFGTTVHRLLEHPAESVDEFDKTFTDVFGHGIIEDKEKADQILNVYNAASSLIAANNVNPLAKEYLVTDGRIAGSVDLIADVNGEPAIVDYKFTYNADIEYLSWQTSIYAYLFYKMTDQRLPKAYALWVPKRDVSLGWFREIPMKSDEEIEALITGEIITKDDSYPVQVKEAQMALANILMQEKEIAERKKMLQATLHKFMEESGVKQIKSDYYTISYVEATTRKSLDSKRLQAEHPEINLEDYQKVTNVKSSVKITVK